MEFPLVEKTLEREGCSLHYWVSALPGHPWLVLLHGAGADHRMFDLQIPLLLSKYNLLLPDSRGQGLSRVHTGALTPSAFVEDTLAMMDAEGVNHAAFIGHSLGGNLAQEIACRHPERAAALVFIDCTCNTMKLTALERFAVNCTRPILAAYPWKTMLRQSAIASAVQPAAREYLMRVLGAQGKQGFIDVMVAGTSFLHYDETYRINKPVLLVCGEKDGTGNIRTCAPKWAAHEPDCEFHMMRNTGHCANMDSPEEFNGILLDFLERRYA